MPIFALDCFLNIKSGIENNIIISLLFCIAFFALSQYTSKIIVNSLIRYLGKISFSVYLIHFAVIHWIEKFSMVFFENNATINYLIRLFVIILVTCLIATITYYYIEQPMQQIGKKIIIRREKNRLLK